MSAKPSADFGSEDTTPGCSRGSSNFPEGKGGICAVHQPNLFPRLATLAKVFAADFWVVLDDVQFARRDYQHRARLARLNAPDRRQWLSIDTHLPRGRSTLIREVLLDKPLVSQKRLRRMLAEYYRPSPHWASLQTGLEQVTARFATPDRLLDVAETSTLVLLRLLGWRGRAIRSSTLRAATGRSERLADLTAATGSRIYLCGTGGMRYIDDAPFTRHALSVVPFRTPTVGMWEGAREISSLWAMMGYGPGAVTTELSGTAASALLAARAYKQD